MTTPNLIDLQILKDMLFGFIRRVQTATSLDQAAYFADMTEQDVRMLLGPIDLTPATVALTDSTMELDVAF